MKRLLLLCVVLAASAFAGQDKSGEVMQVLHRMVTGDMSVNAGVNRLSFLNAGAWASAQIIEMLKKDFEPRRRLILIEALSAIGIASPAVEGTLVQALNDDDIGMRMAAIRGLGKLRSPRAVGTLTALLTDKATGIRRESAKALGLIGQASAGAALMTAAKKEDDIDVRVVMIGAVGQVNDAKQAKALEAFLTSDSESTRYAAAQSLCMMGSKKGLDFAKGLLVSEDAAVRLQGVRVFEGAPAKVTKPLLTSLLTDKDDRVRANAARIMAAGGEKAMADWLVIESYKVAGDRRLRYEDEIEKLRLSDEDRKNVLKRAGLMK